jgi:hypothetical protein
MDMHTAVAGAQAGIDTPAGFVWNDENDFVSYNIIIYNGINNNL